jgi:non-ribosomal peptide synthetase component F
LRQAFLDKDIFERLNQLVSQTNTTQFITLFAVFNILLNKLSNQNDLVIGTLAADRDLPEIENIIGLLFNNLAIRTKLQPEQSFLDLLGQVKQNVLDGFANKDYSFDQLVEKLNPSRDLSRSPIFNVVFQHEKAKDKSLNLLGIKTDYKIFSNNTTKFDIKLRIVEENDFMTFFCEYNTDLFYPETIQGWLGYYINILKQVLEHPKTKIKDLDLLNEEERKKLIYGKYE